MTTGRTWIWKECSFLLLLLLRQMSSLPKRQATWLALCPLQNPHLNLHMHLLFAHCHVPMVSALNIWQALMSRCMQAHRLMAELHSFACQLVDLTATLTS